MENYCIHCMGPLKGNFCGFCGHRAGEYQALPHHLVPGTVLSGKYLVGRALGEGGFGITYIGRDLNLDLKVAIKEYYPSGLVNRNNTATAEVSANLGDAQAPFEKGRSSFLQEARILAKFAGEPGIVGVRDFFTANNTAYIVMDYLEGMTLRDYLKKQGPMSFDAVTRLLSPVFASLQQVHSQGLIHRDISPDNIMLLDNGQVKLLDFGAARNVTGIDERSLSVMLKPGYAPEEQYRTKGKQGPWTDVYALSATIYRCITGQNPEEAMNRVFVDELQAPSALGAQISPSQEAALLKGLAVLQKNRYQSVGELLSGFSGTAPASAPAPAPAPVSFQDDYATRRIAQPVPAPVPAAAPEIPKPVSVTAPNVSEPVPGAAPADPAPKGGKGKKKPNLPCLILSYLFAIGAIVLLSSGIYGFMDNGDLITLITGVVCAVPAVLLSLPFFRRTEKGVSYRSCLVLAIITGILLLMHVALMFMVADQFSYYITGLVLFAALFYFLMRHAFATKKSRARMNRGCIITLVVLVLALVVYTIGSTLSHVTIGDQRISRNEASVSISGDMITEKQLEKLTSLRKLESLSITTCFLDDTAISYISQMTSLTSLSLYNNEDITDISALSGLTNLQKLNVGSTSITDISVVANMPQLTSLTISDTDVVDLSPIAALTELRSLEVSNITTADWSTLTLPAEIMYFYGENSEIDTLAFLSTVENPNTLILAGNHISDLRPLAQFDTISSIDLSFNEISDLTGICDASSLDLSGNQITDLSPLGLCTSLQILILSSNSVEDLTPLGSCPKIYHLELDNNQITDIAPLAAMNLERLNLENNQISDLSPLATSISMVSLYISGNQIADISVLAGMSQLDTFEADSNQISDISPLLSTLVPNKCTYLHLSYNNISDITPLREFQSLETAYLSGNPITDASPLAACQSLTRVSLDETAISDLSPFASLQSLRSLSLIRTPATTFSLSSVPQDGINFQVSYSEGMDLDSITAMREKGCSFNIYDVPENMVREMRNYGSPITVAETDLYLHPVETIEEALGEGEETEGSANG